VNFTVRDIVEKWDSKRYGDITILTDGASSVPGFEKAGEDFVQEMQAKGCRCVKVEAAFE